MEVVNPFVPTSSFWAFMGNLQPHRLLSSQLKQLDWFFDSTAQKELLPEVVRKPVRDFNSEIAAK